MLRPTPNKNTKMVHYIDLDEMNVSCVNIKRKHLKKTITIH